MGQQAIVDSVGSEALAICRRLGVPESRFAPDGLPARSPINGRVVAHLHEDSPATVASAVGRAGEAQLRWRTVPAPRRGEFVRILCEELRANKEDLGRLVTLEVGKIPSEGLGEVQEMIDICDLAVGQSRQLFGLTIATERPNHRMMETWHPMGVCGVVTAFNFPVAVWCWNAALAFVCGNSVVWKPSEKTPLTAVAVEAIVARAMRRFGADAPAGLLEVLIGGRSLSEALVDDERVPVVSATGSTAMGRAVGPRLARRFARSILELGGNNAAIVAPSADLELAVRAVAFAAMGTAGQRCTTLRRIFAHESIYETLIGRLKRVYQSVAVGSPLEPGSLVGPLIDAQAYAGMRAALDEAAQAGGRITGGGRELAAKYPDAYYARPALVEMPAHTGPMLRETFAPILYAMPYRTLPDAIRLHNDVGGGLSSSIFTMDVREAETFISSAGSDCGVANVNIGPSGAEIGGAFGGEKESGGGREAGADAWKFYMRRATNTINYGTALPLAQGVEFDIG